MTNTGVSMVGAAERPTQANEAEEREYMELILQEAIDGLVAACGDRLFQSEAMRRRAEARLMVIEEWLAEDRNHAA